MANLEASEWSSFQSKLDVSSSGELESVLEERKEHVFYLFWVGFDQLWDRLVDMKMHVQALELCLDPHPIEEL